MYYVWFAKSNDYGANNLSGKFYSEGNPWETYRKVIDPNYINNHVTIFILGPEVINN